MFIAIVTLLQMLLLLGQIGCLVYCFKEAESPLDVCYGFGIWAFLPIMLLGQILENYV